MKMALRILAWGIIPLFGCIEGGRTFGQDKAFTPFNLIRFQNHPCTSNDNKNGTCYTADECADKAGIAAGGCANGYGVCCVFSLTCGGIGKENTTYFESSGTEVGQCRVKICKCQPNVCQLRLDFNTFIIAGPSTSVTSVGLSAFGVIEVAGALAVSSATQCLTDQFSVTNPNGAAPPVICGTNTGEHMYVPASDMCTEANFQFGEMAIDTRIPIPRQWLIKITQYSCGFPNLAPVGCLQYFYGSPSGVVKSFNFDGGMHLANQKQNICVRRERNKCRICWTTADKLDFQVSGMSGLGDSAKGANLGAVCCGYGTDGMATTGYDCLIIPGAEKDSNGEVKADQFCGRSQGLVTHTSSGMPAVTVCSSRQPFMISFISDQWEFATAEGMEEQGGVGFKLTYLQTDC